MRTVRLDDKVAIITGGTEGIGLATASRFAGAGASVAVVSRTQENLDRAAGRIRDKHPGSKVIGLSAHVQRDGDMDTVVKTVLERWGRLDILIASAGVLRPPGSTLTPLSNMSSQDWDTILDVNLKGVFLANRAVIGAMTRQGSGHIVNISSTSGRKGYAFDSAYCASKFGIVGLTESLAQEVALKGIKVQLLLPGAIDTPMWEQNGPFQRPENALAPERLAELLLRMVCMPPDSILGGVVVEPFAKPEGAAWHRDSERRGTAQAGCAS